MMLRSGLRNEEETLKETEAYQQAKAEFDAAVQNLDPNLPDYEQRTKELERKFRAPPRRSIKWICCA